MSIEKEQIPIIDAMLKTEFTGVIFRTLSGLLNAHIGDLLSTVKFKCDKPVSVEALIQVKEKYYKQLLQERHIKKELQVEINKIEKRKTDILVEILKQYGLSATDESTHFHDCLGTIFDDQLWRIRMIVNMGNYEGLMGRV